MSRRNYRNGQATTLAFPVSALDTTIEVNSATSFPTQYPYTLILEPDGALEEVIDVTNGTGTTLTVVRGVDGTTASSHSAGVQIYHGVSARDHDEANAHNNATSNVHGVTGGLVGTAGDQSIAGVKNFTGALQTAGSPVVSTAGNQTVGGVKTFTSRPVVSGNGDVVSTGGAQTIDGLKTFSTLPTTPSGDVATLNGTQAVTNKNLSSPTNNLGIKGGRTGINTDASGRATFTHGLGAAPAWVVLTSENTGVYWPAVISWTSTTVTVQINNKDTGVLVSSPFNIHWVAGIN